MTCPLLSVVVPLIDNQVEETHDPARGSRWWDLARALFHAAGVYAYLCLPRVALVTFAPHTELQLTRGFFDQTLAYVGILCGISALATGIGSATLARIVRAWVHAEFILRSGEALLMYQFGMGYSPLAFYHIDIVSLRIALQRDWMTMGCVLTLVATAEFVLRRLTPARRWSVMRRPERVVACLLMLFAFRSAHVLHRERSRLPQDVAIAAFATNWWAYTHAERAFETLSITTTERANVLRLGIHLAETPVTPAIAHRPLNLVTVYLEAFQANFAHDELAPGLTPHLDAFAATSVRFSNFYNAVTPTINAIISSQCGILSQVENGSLDVDRGYTRNLLCLSDVLHAAGYQQIFLGGGDSSFSGKRLFLDAHHYDDVWGWERWRANRTYTGERRNTWGLHDTDLIREAIARLPTLRANGPFHLSMLTVETHQPGYVAPDCPVYRKGAVTLNAIHCTDYAVGMLVDALRSGGYLSDTVVVLMGDHMMLPGADASATLGAAAGWFGKVFATMYLPPDGGQRTIEQPSYTPDFVPTILDALGFQPVPDFPVGHSILRETDPARVLVAPRFQIVEGVIIPARPAFQDGCSAGTLTGITIGSRPDMFTDCERDKIMTLLEQALMITPSAPVTTHTQ